MIVSFTQQAVSHRSADVPEVDGTVLGKGGGEMPNPCYPLFLRDFDNCFYVVPTVSKLSSIVEMNDIDELSGWDAAGHAITLRLVDGEMSVLIVNETIQSDQLIFAIRKYAEVYGRAKPDDESPDSEDPLQLFLWAEEKVEKYRRSTRFLSKLSQFLNRLLTR